MTKAQKLGVAVVIVGLAAFFAARGLFDQAQPPAPEAPKQVVAPQARLDEGATRKALSDALVSKPLGSGDASDADEGYFALEARVVPGADVGLTLSQLVQPQAIQGDVQAIMVVAHLNRPGGPELASIPMLVAERVASVASAKPEAGAAGAIKFRTAWSLPDRSLRLTPYLPVADKAPLTVQVDVVYGFAAVDGLVRQAKAVADDVIAALGSVDDTAEPARLDRLNAAARPLASLFEGEAVRRLDGVVGLKVDVGRRAEAWQVALGSDASIGFQVAHRPSLLSTANRAKAAAALRADSDLMARFWAAGDVGALSDACGAMADQLKTSVGLSAEDGRMVLAGFGPAWTIFSPIAADFDIACVGHAADQGEDAAAGGEVSVATLNKGLMRIGGVMRSAEPAKAMTLLQGFLAPSVQISDGTGLWLSDGNPDIIDLGDRQLLPRADSDTAAEYLASLPVSAYACFHTVEAGRGFHRATLMQLVGDDALMQMNVAFDAGGQVIGVAIDEASQGEACRATGGRTSGDDACYFARQAKAYRNVDVARCNAQ